MYHPDNLYKTLKAPGKLLPNDVIIYYVGNIYSSDVGVNLNTDVKRKPHFGCCGMVSTHLSHFNGNYWLSLSVVAEIHQFDVTCSCVPLMISITNLILPGLCVSRLLMLVYFICNYIIVSSLA